MIYLEKYKMLVLDDNQTNLKIISMMLSKWHIKHEVTGDISEAYEKLKNGEYHVLISDYSMPGLNGFQFIKKIKEELPDKNLKTLMISSDTVNTNEKLAREKGIDTLIYKPVKQSSFYNAILKTLDIKIEQNKKRPRPKISKIPHAEKYKILLAEDNTINQKVAHRIFSSLGFTIDIAENGKIALDYALKKNYDIIFMDYQMPELNGIEATEALRKWNITTPIIALTANAMKGDREQFLAAGMDDYLSKPFKVGELLAVLNKYLKPVDDEQ